MKGRQRGSTGDGEEIEMLASLHIFFFLEGQGGVDKENSGSVHSATEQRGRGTASLRKALHVDTFRKSSKGPASSYQASREVTDKGGLRDRDDLPFCT